MVPDQSITAFAQITYGRYQMASCCMCLCAGKCCDLSVDKIEHYTAEYTYILYRELIFKRAKLLHAGGNQSTNDISRTWHWNRSVSRLLASSLCPDETRTKYESSSYM